MKKFLPLLFLMACAHATQTADQPKAAQDAGEKQTEKKEKAVQATTHATSQTTKQMFKPEGMKKMQAALGKKSGKEVKETGLLDTQTQNALRTYQKSEGIAETGLPDYEVVRRLGMEPDDIFHHEPPAERVGVK